MDTVSWLEHLKERDHLGCLGTWEDNIKMDLKGMGCKFMDWIYLAYIIIADGIFLISWSNC
jgi:hypothetical protein